MKQSKISWRRHVMAKKKIDEKKCLNDYHIHLMIKADSLCEELRATNQNLNDLEKYANGAKANTDGEE